MAGIDLTAAEPAGGPPRFVEPMLATLSDRPFDDEDWLFEIKWDGYRVQAVVDEGKVRLYTRNGHDAATYFPDLLPPPRTWLAADDAILDGEVVALDAEGRPDFSLLQARISQATGGRVPGQWGRGSDGGGRPQRSPEGGDAETAEADEEAGRAPLVYQAFDLLRHNGRSLLRVPLEDRKRLLRSVLTDGRRVRFSGHVVGDGVAFHRAAAGQGLEGIVAKLRRSRYEPGRRSNAWLKLKLRPAQELVVAGWTPGEGSARGLGAVVVGVMEEGRLRFAGKVGSGFDERSRRRLRERLDELATDRCPFDPDPGRRADLRGVTWVEPRVVIRAELGGWSRDGLVRQAAFKGLEEGREPANVVRESAVSSAVASADAEAAAGPAPTESPSRSRPTARPMAAEHAEWAAATSDELAALDALGREGRWVVGGQELKLTNLDKVLFPGRPGVQGSKEGARPEPPITKRELIGYFARIGPAMLPHLADRPLNLQRFPDGAQKPGFWQKALRPTDPTWLRRWREVGVERRDANEHLVADRTATLCWLGNQAAFEIHAWTGRLEAPFTPTFALIDIDPGERTTWEETLVLARLFRTALEHLGVRGYPKLTGGRGVHIWVPIEPRYTFEETSAWVEGLSRAVGGDRAGPGQLGVGQGSARGSGSPRLHPERADQDARRAVRRAASARGARLGPDRLGRAGRRYAATRRLDDPDAAGPGRRAGRPVRRSADGPAGPAEAGLGRGRAPLAIGVRVHDAASIDLRQLEGPALAQQVEDRVVDVVLDAGEIGGDRPSAAAEIEAHRRRGALRRRRHRVVDRQPDLELVSHDRSLIGSGLDRQGSDGEGA